MRGTLIVLLLSFCTIVSATNYYVKNGGDDTSDGKSDATAWATITKVNSMTYSLGDTVFFKKGSTWRATLKATRDGTAGSYMCFANYGSGDNPKILGSEVTTWSNYSSNVWVSTNTFTNPYSVGIAGAEVFFVNSNGTVSWGTHKDNISKLTSEYDWTYVSGYIYVFSSSDPDTHFTSVEIPQRAYIFDLNYKSYIHIKGIDMFYCGEVGVTYSATGGGWQSKTGLIIENCEIGYVSIKNSDAGYGTEAVYNNMIVRKCEIHDCGRRSISLHLYGSYTATNILIEDNYFHDGYHTTGTDFSVGNGSGMHIIGAIVRRNLFYDPPNSTAYAHQIFLQNFHYADTTLSSLTNIYIYSNIFITPTGAAINMEGSQSVYIYNNTFYNHNNAGSDAQIWVDNNNASVKIKNNIFYTNSTNDAGGVELFVRSGQSASAIDADYNLYYRINNDLRVVEKESTGKYYMNTFPSLRTALGWEKHSPAPGDPLFLSSTDYHVQAGSPSIGAGLAIPKVATDYDGKPFANPPNIGCYSTEVSSANPAYVSSSVENASPSALVITYDLNLANIVPAASAFTVMVNSTARAVTKVAVSGTKVSLTLASAVVYGDVISLSYIVPSTNPLQTPSGGMAASLSSVPVTNNVLPISPVYVSSSIENATPSIITMVFNLSLANIVPPSSAFVVKVNSVVRNVTYVSVSAKQVQLTFASPVIYGDVVTVAYTKPAANPLQTPDGGQVASFTAKTVTNNVNPPSPVYVSAAIENATPSVLTMTYNLSLRNIVPVTTAFTVTVNAAARGVTLVTISDNKVLLTLASAVAAGDVVTVAYAMPANNPLQTTAGGIAASISAQPVTNNVGVANNLPVIVTTYETHCNSGFIGNINASGSYDADHDNLTFTWKAPSNVPISSTSTSKIQYLAPIVTSATTVNFVLNLSDGKGVRSLTIPIQILPYKQELDQAAFSNVGAVSFLSPDYPSNIADGDLNTKWSGSGDGNWIAARLNKPFKISYIQLAFPDSKSRSSFFDVYASSDSVLWDNIMNDVVSCYFSGNYQIFDFPESHTGTEYSFIKIIGHGNSSDTWNYISELKAFGYPRGGSSSEDTFQFSVYPNPANDLVVAAFENPALENQKIRVINQAGQVEETVLIEPSTYIQQIPLNVKSGFYILQLLSNNIIVGAQKLIVIR